MNKKLDKISLKLLNWKVKHDKILLKKEKQIFTFKIMI